jgi:hypothetical protein
MSTLRAILEIQGSLDTAVIGSDDPRVAELADQFLPGTSANTEWYREIEAFMFPRANDPEVPENQWPRTEANPIGALREVNGDRTERNVRPSVPELSRLMYGIGAVIHLNSVVPTWPLPTRDSHGEDETRALLADVIALAGPPDTSFDSNRQIVGERLDDVVDMFATRFTGWRAWYDVAGELAGMGVLSGEVASVPLCLPSVVTVDGIESVVIDAELSSNKVSLNALKAVVDPRNWHRDCPSFFCEMDYRGLRTDGWRRVLEYVGFCDVDPHISPRLRTMLKFYKTTVNGPGRYEARLDYDLNDPVPDKAGDGKITVDRGFINMWTGPTGDPTRPPVYVRTRKVAHIEGLRPYTMKRFVCAMGYAFVVAEMLFGSALDYKGGGTGYTPWDDPSSEVPEQPGQQQGQGTPQKKPSDNSVASTAISMVADCVQELSVKQFDLADKWLAGQLTVADLTQFSAEVGARIASDPWKFLQTISQPKGDGK